MGAQGKVKQWADVAYTATAAGSESATVTLPNGQVGKPVILKGSGSVSGVIKLTFGNAAVISVPVNPNAPAQEAAIPSEAFPALTGSVSLTIEADGAGTIRAYVGFS